MRAGLTRARMETPDQGGVGARSTSIGGAVGIPVGVLPGGY